MPEQTSGCETDLVAIDRGRIAQSVGVDVASQGEHEFVGGGRAEDVSEVAHDFVRSCVGHDSGRIGQGPGSRPPNGQWVLVLFDLARVGPGQLGVVADRIVHFASSFPTILWAGVDVLVVVPAICGRGRIFGLGIIPGLQQVADCAWIEATSGNRGGSYARAIDVSSRESAIRVAVAAADQSRGQSGVARSCPPTAR